MSLGSFLGGLVKTGAAIGSRFVDPSGTLGKVIGSAGDLGGFVESQSAQADANALNEKAMAFQREMQEAQQAFNSAEAQKSRDFQSMMMDKQNAYNSPSAQISRLQEAGVNPLGQNLSTATADGVGSIPATSSVAGSPALANPSLDAAQSRLLNAQAENLENQTQTEQQRRPWLLENDKMSLNVADSNISLNKRQEQNLLSQMDKTASEIALNEQKIAESKAYANLLDSQGQLNQKQLDHYEELFDAQLKKTFSEIDVNVANTHALSSQIKLNIAKAAEAYANAALAEEKARTEMSQQGLNNSQQDLNEDLHILNGVEVAVVRKHEKAIMSWNWNDKLRKYDLSVSAYNAEKAKGLAVIEDSRKRQRLGEWRNRQGGLYGPVNGFLDDAEIITGIAGNVFSGSYSYGEFNSNRPAGSINIINKIPKP